MYHVGGQGSNNNTLLFRFANELVGAFWGLLALEGVEVVARPIHPITYRIYKSHAFKKNCIIREK